MALPDDPIPAFITALRAQVTPTNVFGERPADLASRLPAVVVSRVGGGDSGSWQDTVADRPLVSLDCYALGLPAARQLAQAARRAVRAVGAREQTGPQVAPDAAEASGVRRVVFTASAVARG